MSDDDQSSNLLYHYTTTQGLIGILESDCLWATDVRFLSDASEASYGREVAVEALGVAIEAAQNEQRLLSLKIAADYFTDELGPDTSSIVVCFSEQPDHLSQWQAYGRGGGFAIGFDRSNLERPRTPAHRHPFKRDARPFQLVPVIYDRAAQLRAAAETIREHLDHPKMTNFGPGEELVGALFPQVAVFKNAAFEEEREWRAMTDVIVNFYPLKFRPSSWGPVPYGTFPLRVADSVESPIREVRVGPSAHPDTVRTGVQLLLKSHDLDVPVISSEVPLR